MSPRAKLIGIAGPSCSGKTLVATLVAERLAPQCLIVSCDYYYEDRSHMTVAERRRVNFDHPDAIEHALLAAHLAQLAAGESVAMPTYRFDIHTRGEDTITVEPKPVIIVEGLHVLHWPDVRDMLALKAYVDASHDACLRRRIERDVAERGRTPEEARQRYEADVRRMADEFVIPSKRFADLVLDGAAPVEQSVDAVVSALEHSRARL